MRKNLPEHPAATASCLDREQRKQDGTHEDFSGTHPDCSAGYKLATYRPELSRPVSRRRLRSDYYRFFFAEFVAPTESTR